jgi:hypothetical protein
MAGRSVANRSETVRVPTQRDRSRSCASSGARSARGAAGTGSGWRGGPVSATGGRARRLAKRSARLCCSRQGSSRSGCWTSQLARARSWRTSDCPGTPGELCAAPAVPPAVARRRSGHRGRRHRAPWPVGRQRGCGSWRRVPAHRRRCAQPVRAPLALARSPESGRGPL